jgi:hypothetical protein
MDMIRGIEDIAFDWAHEIVFDVGGDPENQIEVINMKNYLMAFLEEVEQNWPSRKDNGTVPTV